MNEPESSIPPPLPDEKPLAADASFGSIFESLLKQPISVIKTIHKGDHQGNLTLQLLGLTLAGFLIFGVTLGSFSFGAQLWAAPLKTLVGITFASLICLPSLYIFTALTGTSLRLSEIIQGLAASLALIAALLLGFTPVLWVFSQSTSSEPFFGFLVGLTWVIAVAFGTGFLLKMLNQSDTERKNPVRIWIGIFLLVTLQMSTTLRPLIGSSDHLFTTEKRFFLEHWMKEMSQPPNSPEPAQKEVTAGFQQE